jgi:hypothetical protein
LAAIFAIGNPVALLASALDRLTRGFISITIIRPVFGLMANWMLDAAGFDTDFADNREASVSHPLVFFIGQRLGGSDGDGVAGVDTHRIEVLDGADDNDVVVDDLA